jgi:predicted nucleotidyltransferase
MASVVNLRACEVALVLEQRPEGLRLAALAEILGLGLSSAQRTVGSLVDGGVAASTPGRHPHHRLAPDHSPTDAFVALAHKTLPVERAIDLVCRATPVLDFAARDSDGYLLVDRRLTDPSDEVRFDRALRAIVHDRPHVPTILRYDRQTLGERLTDDPELRRRAVAMTVVRGAIERTFATIPGPRAPEGPPLGRLHPSLRAPSRRAIGRLARRHRLREIVVFGSAVRADFRPDSDVDVLVEPAPDARLGLDARVELEESLERLFEREVDLLNARYVRPAVLRRAHAEGVRLHGRA